MCLSDETLKSVGSFYLVPMSGEVQDSSFPTLGKCVTYRVFIILEKKN